MSRPVERFDGLSIPRTPFFVIELLVEYGPSAFSYYNKYQNRGTQMTVGPLSLDFEADRIHVSFDDGNEYNLHCGMTLDSLVDGKWLPTRIEFMYDWYLVGLLSRAIFRLNLKSGCNNEPGALNPRLIITSCTLSRNHSSACNIGVST